MADVSMLFTFNRMKINSGYRVTSLIGLFIRLLWIDSSITDDWESNYFYIKLSAKLDYIYYFIKFTTSYNII